MIRIPSSALGRAALAPRGAAWDRGPARTRAPRAEVAVRRAAILALALLSACAPELGPCDPGEARRVLYDESGAPAFAGQALMIQSCGHGAFCHAGDIPIANRHGVPGGLEYDLQLASFDAAAAPEETERLRAMQRRAYAHRHAIWDAVSRGAMPPSGAAGDPVLDAAPAYGTFDPSTGAHVPAPAIDTPEAREILRNWLACGLPVIERTAPSSDQVLEPVGWIVPGVDVEPLEPRWDDIYARMIEPRCASAPCHGANREGGLDLGGGSSEALRTLLDGAASGEECADESARWIDLDAPDASLLLHKLSGRDAAGEPVCGRIMPMGGARLDPRSIDAIREWIAAGAPET